MLNHSDSLNEEDFLSTRKTIGIQLGHPEQMHFEHAWGNKCREAIGSFAVLPWQSVALIAWLLVLIFCRELVSHYLDFFCRIWQAYIHAHAKSSTDRLLRPFWQLIRSFCTVSLQNWFSFPIDRPAWSAFFLSKASAKTYIGRVFGISDRIFTVIKVILNDFFFDWHWKLFLNYNTRAQMREYKVGCQNFSFGSKLFQLVFTK